MILKSVSLDMIPLSPPSLSVSTAVCTVLLRLAEDFWVWCGKRRSGDADVVVVVGGGGVCHAHRYDVDALALCFFGL